jgi:quinol monooxygenase YgiN
MCGDCNTIDQEYDKNEDVIWSEWRNKKELKNQRKKKVLQQLKKKLKDDSVSYM